MKESWNLTTLKKSKKHTLLKKWFGFIGKLSANSIAANRKLFRTCTATLCLCLVLMFSFLAVFAISDVNNTKAEQDNHFDVNITMEPGQQVDQALIQELKALPHVTNEATYTMANCAIWVSDKDLSTDFVASGGFGTKAAGEYVVSRDGQYRIPCVLIGLEQDSYDACLAKAGMEPLENGTAIVVNSVVKNPDSRGYEAKKEMTSYLNLETGQSLNITEKFLDSIQGNYTFDLNVGTTIQELPDIGLHTAFYTLPILVPMDEYYSIIGNFSEDRAVYNYRTYMNLAVKDGLDAQIQKDANQICSAYLSADDFYTSSKTERAITRDQLTNATMLVVYSLTALFRIVGISSATSAILNSLYQRRKDFAMLRSVGLDKKGLHRLLSIEGFLLAFKPILFGLPVLFFIIGAVLWMQDVTFGEFLGVFLLWGLLAFIVLTLLLISGIYAFASRQIRKDIVVEVLKDETV